jgi:transglutaminase-like putative cysteine protease
MSSAAAEIAAARPASAGREGLGLRLLAFFSLAAFAAVRYASLIATPPAGRVVLVALCVTAGCGLLAASARLGRGPAVTLGRIVLVLGTFALSMLALHIPAHLLVPGQWAHLADRLSGGLDRVGDWLWPYRGGDRWAQAAVLLPVPAVLLAAGCAWFWPSPSMLATRRALALGALLAIFVTGTANAPTSVPAFDGFVLMALLAGALLLPLPAASDTGRALCWLAVCAAAALSVQAALRSAGPWIQYREAASAATPSASFQWDQLYGPNLWPHSEAPMLTVTEARPELLRVTSLDRFDGLRFLRSAEPPGSVRADLPPADIGRWSERAIVQVKGLRSAMLTSAGGLPNLVRGINDLQPSPERTLDGTAVTSGVAPSGATYEVVSYDPQPPASLARRAPRTYPRSYLPYAQFELPAPGASALASPNLAAEAHGRQAPALLVGPSAPGRTPAEDPATAALIEASPYAPMYALARRLAAGAAPFDVAERMVTYLQDGYAYDLRVKQSRYPLEAFLFSQRRGYCQQFSGAMTLMLRMDGIPARVGVGFRPAVIGPRPGTWNVRESDAHAWVEVFFTGIGWVAFDPTPTTTAAVQQAGSTALSRSVVLGGQAESHGGATAVGNHSAEPSRAARGGAQGPWTALAIALAVLAALAALAQWRGRARLRRALSGDGEAAVAELRRALVKLGRAEPGLTLAKLERELAGAGEARAAEYVRAVGRRRFRAERAAVDAPAGRRRLRRALAPSRGIAGRARALAALPPAWIAALQGAARRRG